MELYETRETVCVELAPDVTTAVNSSAGNEHVRIEEIRDRMRSTFFSLQDGLERTTDRTAINQWLGDISNAVTPFINSVDWYFEQISHETVSAMAEPSYSSMSPSVIHPSVPFTASEQSPGLIESYQGHSPKKTLSNRICTHFGL